MITINIALILKYIAAGLILIGIGELIAFFIASLIVLAQCFIEWSWSPIHFIDWCDVRMVFCLGVLIGFIETIFLIASRVAIS